MYITNFSTQSANTTFVNAVITGFASSPGDGRLGEVVAVELAHGEADVALGEAELDPPLLERLGELLELLEVRRLLGRGLESRRRGLDRRWRARRRRRALLVLLLLLLLLLSDASASGLQGLLLLEGLQLLGGLRHCLLYLRDQRR